ncbi:glycoside hydrolase domain-containing protein [Mycobacterium sp. AT1]|uniref:glycoside hydrolase domain-containing protein n=1 Tax=Mycobacterium sp. AT1 TaxID=1961706 RepID=UPI002101C89D|nr:glycoside hydrolase domain-containing protein [Mycobacterium sp. AT1]
MDFVEDGRLADAFRRHSRSFQRWRRPGGAWMLGKPIQLPEARDLYQGGLKSLSCHRFDKADTADWLGGQASGVQHAKRGWQLQVAAGGFHAALIHASIDDDPTPEQYKQLVAPICAGGRRCWATNAWGLRQLQDRRLGLAGRSGCLLLATPPGFAEGFTHPAAHLHRVEIDARSVGGVGVDLNHVLKPRFGQWD